jgi:hypothetical protein
MFLKIAGSSPFTLKTALHIKIPFADNKLSISGYTPKPYNSIYNIIQCAESNDFVSYFYTKNNLISYHRENGKDRCFIIPNLLKDSYDIVSINDLGYRIESTKNSETKTVLAKMADGTIYLISNNMMGVDGEKALMILNLNNKNVLYKKIQEEYMYIDWFYPIANVIVPILRVTAKSLFLDLVNMLNGRTDTITCDLACILRMLKGLIKENISSKLFVEKITKSIYHHNSHNVNSFYLTSVNYDYQEHEGNIYYVKSIAIRFTLNVHGKAYAYDIHNVSLNIELMDGEVNLYWLMDDSQVRISNKYGYTVDYFKTFGKKFFLFKQQFDDKITNIKLHNQIYVNKCYGIYQDRDGFRILGKNVNLGGVSTKASLHSYKHYKIFIFYMSDLNKRYKILGKTDFTEDGIAIVDTKKHEILFWTYKLARADYCMQQSGIGYYYYSDKAQKLIFLSENSYCFSVIDANKIEIAFDKFVNKQRPECQEKSNTMAKEFAKSFHIIPMIIDEVARNHKVPAYLANYSDMKVKIIGNYICKKSDVLYSLANYNVDDTEYIGLFAWPIYENNVVLNLLYYKPTKSLYNITYKKSAPKMPKIELDSIGNKWINSHLSYNFHKDIFMNIENNRISANVINLHKNFYSSSDFISKHNNFLFVKYRGRNQVSIAGELCFIVSIESALVKRLPVTYV